MRRRALGRSGITLPPLVFGGNVLGWTADKATSFHLLDQLVERGFDAIDTADIYSHWVPGHQGGESETVIGEWLARRGRRDDVLILTKVGGAMPGRGKGLGRAWIKSAVEDSLCRLGTDHIDLYQSHFDDAEAPMAETLGAYAELIAEGKVRAIGASNFSAARLREALRVSAELAIPRYESLQPEYNLVAREGFEAELQPLCHEAEIGVITYFSLASGFLTGKYRSAADLGQSQRGERAGKFLDARGLRVLTALDEVSARLGATPAQVAVSWLLAKPAVTAPIASATSIEQLAALLDGAELTLDADAVAALDRASA